MKTLEELDLLIAERKSKISELREELQQAKAERNLLLLESGAASLDLSAYEGKSISSITALNSEGKEVFIPDDEMMFVRNGKLTCSSFDQGLLDWDEESNSYVKIYHFSRSLVEIAGFVDIEAEDD